MQVKEVMSPGVECISPGESLREAAQKMRKLDVGPLPVCENDRLIGILTDRDIVVRAVADGSDPHATTVRDTMTPQIVYCFEDQEVAEVARLMEQKQIRRLVVLNRSKRLVGIISLGDLAVATGDEHCAARTLESISEPGGAKRL
jgi:CBS domain-containing protein